MQERVEIAWMQASAVNAPPGEFLSAAEMEKLAQMRFARRREEWLLGRWTAKRLLGVAVPALAGAPSLEWMIANEADGQPYVLAGGQRLPGCLSISHRAGRGVGAWCAAAGVGLGIDLEKVEPRSEAFVRDYFTEAELALLNAATRDRDAVLIWSAKEAMLKALGKGLRLDTRAVEVLRIANDQTGMGWNNLEVRCLAQPDLEWWAGWQVHDDFVLTLAVCAEGLDPSALRIHEMSS